MMSENIHRIIIPFEDIYTTVFVLRTDNEAIVFDTATFALDMDKYVFPVLERMQVEPKYVFISHNHRDHAGGLQRIVERYRNICIVSGCGSLKEKFANMRVARDGDILLDAFRVVAIPGHTSDSMGLLDLRTGILLTGDSLQLYGIYGSGNWGANIRFPRAHLEALDKLRNMELSKIIASHDYHPSGHVAQGAAEINQYLSYCEDALKKIVCSILEHPEWNDAEVAAFFNETKGLPKLGAHVVEAVRREMI